jgi:EAL domain-containing protein (putative c-di-GMP-specific phosphodiesterase class I)
VLNLAILNDEFWGNLNMDEKFGGSHSRRGKIIFRILNRCEKYEYSHVYERVTLNWVWKILRYAGVNMKNGFCGSKISLGEDYSLTR